LVLVGPSASGKTAVKDFLVSLGAVRYGVTCTTRKKRKGEINGRDYDFLSVKEWDFAHDTGALVEETKYIGDNTVRYGILRNRIEEAKTATKPSLWIVDTNGVDFMRRTFPEATVAIMLHADRETLAYRMRQRGDTPKQVDKRLANYETEFDLALNACDYAIDTCHLDTERVAGQIRFLSGV
jgi:guanylate kinase